MIHLFCLFGCTLPSRPIIVELIYPQPSKLFSIRFAKSKSSRRKMKTRQGVVIDSDKNANANLEAHH